jgi:flagellar biosynthesis component FlhA
MKLEPLRLAEAGGEAALILALVVVPAGLRVLDAELTVVLAAMLLMLTAAAYALHAVTFDYFRLTTGRAVERTDP